MTKPTFEIHPRIGVARVGNSPTEFYLAPETTGGTPIACDAAGTPVSTPGALRYKDRTGAIKRQAARFKIFRHTADGARAEVVVGAEGVRAIEWTVHVANKKAVWYGFSELVGDLMFGEGNSYAAQHVPLRNASVKDRRTLIIDPGPRTLSTPGARATFDRYSIPDDYPHGNFPPTDLTPQAINTLGEMRIDPDGRLLVLGAFGNNGGPPGTTITSYAGASGFFDDIADGYVLATVVLDDGTRLPLEPAYVLIGSPKYAPELVNIVTLDDNAYDVAVRYLGYAPELYQGRPTAAASAAAYDPLAGFNPDYRPNYARDIEPLFRRMRDYRWVAQIPGMVAFSLPTFDPADASPATAAQRQRWFRYLRVPVTPENVAWVNDIPNGPNTLFAPDGVPLMPLQSGDNSVTNTLIFKFLTLTPTQYFFMSQWARGCFDVGPPPPERDGVDTLDRQVLGNCVGGPLSPGIETTWVTRNPSIYSAPFRLKIAHWKGDPAGLAAWYRGEGLATDNDVQRGGGLEPGDLTKQMAIPWQADFFDCTVQTPNMVDPAINQSLTHDGVQVPPSYYVYWWPPQAPMHVTAGSRDPLAQVLDGFVSAPPVFSADSSGTYGVMNNYNIVAAGQPVPYARGVSSFNQMLVSWKDLGFVVNEATAEYPSFVESERSTGFLAQGVVTGEK